MSTFTRLFYTIAATGAILAGCGGGGGSTPVAGITGGGAPVATTAFVKGTITGFGSIFVNGVEFSTSGAQIRIDDNPGIESDLRVGQVVTVQGTINANGTTGTATSVSFNAEVEGPVSSIDPVNTTFVVLGQTVRANAATTFDDSSLAGGFAALNANDVVEVTGFRNGAGELVATRIQRRPGGVVSPFEVNGTVSNLSGTTFNVGFLSVNFAGVTPRDGTLANTACVEVKGTTFLNNVLTATSVEIKGCTLGAPNGARGEVEGIITTFNSASDFFIGGQRVNTTASTTIVTNGFVGGLRANIKVEAEGSFNAAGVLVATKVEIKPDTVLRLLGLINEPNAANSTMRVNGVTVQLGNTTRFEDKSSARFTSFDFADLRVNDYVEIRGFAGTVANTLQAVILERDDVDSRQEIQGFASNLANNTTLVILGVTVDTTGAGVQFKDINDQVILRSAFFAAANGALVKGRGIWNGTTFLANDEVQIESP